MKKQHIKIIHEMRLQGKSAAEISWAIGISADTIRSHIRRHPEVYGSKSCQSCGATLIQPPGRKEKRFCSDRCRMAWWNSHRKQVQKKAYITIVCAHCGKEFESYGKKNRKFCCRDCYDRSRRSYTSEKPHPISNRCSGVGQAVT